MSVSVQPLLLSTLIVRVQHKDVFESYVLKDYICYIVF